MVAVRPLRLRLVRQEWSDRVSSPAHDALSPQERRLHLHTNPDSYMAVTRGLEDIEPGKVMTAAELLVEGRTALNRLRDVDAFGPERGDEFYLYQLIEEDRTLTGLVAGVGVEDYRTGDVKIHEHVKAQRALHLANHLSVVGAQSSPIALAHRPDDTVQRIIDAALTNEALVDVTLPDGLRQRVIPVTSPEDTATLRSVFDGQSLYLIDGHHRAAAAATFRTAAGPGMAEWMLSALFSSDDLINLAHHRLLTPPMGIARALEAMGRARRLRRCTVNEIADRADDEVALLADGEWFALTLPYADAAAEHRSPQERLAALDPSRFQEQILGPLFQLDPEGSDPSLAYRAEHGSLDDLASTNPEGSILAIMRPVSIDVLLEASDHGLVMPPKSTYFVPKVRSGVFLRATNDDS